VRQLRDADPKGIIMKLSELTERQCAFCGDTFMPKVPMQIYDVADCRYRAARQVAFEKRRAEREQREAVALVVDNAQ
jgi:hypothetical protein